MERSQVNEPSRPDRPVRQRYANMTDAEAEAWVRGGGGGPSNVGQVYRPPAPPRLPPAPPRLKREKVPKPPLLTEPRAVKLAEEQAGAVRHYRLPPRRTVLSPTRRDAVSPTHLPVATRPEHGTLRHYLAGCHCLDCSNAANEAAMLGEYKP